MSAIKFYVKQKISACDIINYAIRSTGDSFRSRCTI